MRCVKCNTQLMKPDSQIKEFIGLVCGNEKCDRFGLLTVVAQKESPIITPSGVITPKEPTLEIRTDNPIIKP